MSEPRIGSELADNLLATGVLFMLLSSSRLASGSAMELTLPEGEDEPGNVIEVKFDFLASRYRMTIERVPDR